MASITADRQSLAATLTGGGGDRVFYLDDAPGHVHVLWQSGGWLDQDISETATPAATPAAAGSPLAATTLAGGPWRVFFLDGDNHVHVISWYLDKGTARWNDKDLTVGAKPAGTPAGPGSPLAVTTVSSGAWRVFFLDTDHHVHVLSSYGSWWSDVDLTTLAGAVAAAATSPLAAAARGDGYRVHFLGDDNHVYVIRSVGANKWTHDDLTHEAGPTASPAAATSRLAAVVTGGDWRVFFLDAHQHLHNLWYPGHWQDKDLTDATQSKTPAGASSPLAAGRIGNDLRVFFLDANDHIHTLWDNWTDMDLTDESHSKTTAIAGRPLAVTATSDAWSVFFIGADGNVHVLSQSKSRGAGWSDYDLTTLAASLGLAITSDPQYPWYDGVLPPGYWSSRGFWLDTGNMVHVVSYENVWRDGVANSRATPAAANSPLAATALSAGDWAFFLDGNNNVHGLSQSDGWKDTNLTTNATPPAPPAAADSALAATAVISTTGGDWLALRVFFVAANHHVHVLSRYNGTWTDTNATDKAIPPAPPAAAGSPLAAIPVGLAASAFFLDANGHVHLLTSGGDTWTDTDLTVTATPPATPAAASSPLAATPVASDEWRVFFLDDNHHPHVLYSYITDKLRWTDADLTTRATPPAPAAAAGSPLTAAAFDNDGRAFFLDANQHVHMLSYSGSWADTDLTTEANAPAAAAGSPLTSTTATGQWRVFFENRGVHLLSYAGGWEHEELHDVPDVPRCFGGNSESAEQIQHKNSERQITQQYAHINALAASRAAQPTMPQLEAVIVNGDLTAYGRLEQLGKWLSMARQLRVRVYPALGNHDYANNVYDSFPWGPPASDMVTYMWNWLQQNRSRLMSIDFRQTARDPLEWWGSVLYSGSLAYSFALRGRVHVVMLHYHPSYENSWITYIARLANSFDDHYEIRPSLSWLEKDLAAARARGDAILVFSHACADLESMSNSTGWAKFCELMCRFKVSAIFAGHVHPLCGQMSPVTSPAYPGSVPLFRSGAASYQDYLVADLALDTGSMTVTVYSASDLGGTYAPGPQWQVPLHMG